MDMIEEDTLYEYPLNETVRICLRLEYVFAQTAFHLDKQDYWHNQIVIDNIIDLINILDRPDFKTKITQELVVYKELFSQHLGKEEVEQTKLKALLERLNQNIDYLQSFVGKLHNRIEKVEFLANLRLRLAKTNSLCNFDSMMYHYWLHQSAERRNSELKKWFSYFDDTQKVIALLLSLVRKSGTFEDLTATNGYYERSLDPKKEHKLLRISTKPDCKAYPDFSVGKHRISINFYALNVEERSVQFKEDLEFKWALGD